MSRLPGYADAEDGAIVFSDQDGPSFNAVPDERFGKSGLESRSTFVRDYFWSKPLKVVLADFYPPENANDHFTSDYDITSSSSQATPVLRRGFPFYLCAQFDRPVDFTRDIIHLKFYFGRQQSFNRGMSFTVRVNDNQSETLDESRWDVLINSLNGSTIVLQVQIPVTCPVGEWSCDLFTQSTRNTTDVKRATINNQFFILFNPWHKEDGVYLPTDNERKEYILNETGKVWMGSYRLPQGRRWIFGQFDESVLQVTSNLLNLANLPAKDRGDPVLVARAISAIINSNDDDGLIVGRWGDGPESYADGTAPHAWTGSAAIIQEYARTGNPVKYGQCWVFSALVVTVCRALGIPCRSVTNYISAHDTNSSLTIDKYFDASGQEIEGPNGEANDSCWNFHVWNDVWMSRPDLPSGYGGWQAIDATPQEKSEKCKSLLSRGAKRDFTITICTMKFGEQAVRIDSTKKAPSIEECGPTSVEAVRKGEVGYNFDTPFLFAEVNADLCYFLEDNTSDWGFRTSRIDQYHVGRKIVTKKVNVDDDRGDNDMEDITHLYKNPEGSKEERIAVLTAIRGCDLAKKYYDYPDRANEDVSFDLVEIEAVPFGEPFTALMHIQNNSDESRTIAARLTVNSVAYNGATAHRVKHDELDFELEPNAYEQIRITVEPEEYIHKLTDHSLIKLIAVASVIETKQTWTEEDDFPLIKPNLNIDIEGSLKIGQPSSASFTFQNPLNYHLDSCYVVVEGPGLQRPKTLAFRDVQPYEEVTFVEYFVPKKTGSRKIVGNFFSRQLSDVTGSRSVTVSE